MTRDFHLFDAACQMKFAAQHAPIAAKRKERMTANFLYLGAGYYDDLYDPYDAGFDFSEFKGDVVHPQFCQENLD